MKDNWVKHEFPDCLIDNNVGRANQINSSEIKTAGNFPVIDQGQDFIAGYSDEEDKLIMDGLPYVIFGDHTRCFKFVDFPFIVGADGTKVLSPNPKLFDPKYFYYQLLSFDIPSRGYNRHYKLLKEKIIQKPEIPEQRKIAYILSTLQKAIEQQDKLINHTIELKKALMQKLFTEGTKGEKQKQTEIGLMPVSWEVVEMQSIVDFKTGKLNSNAANENGIYPFFTCSQETFKINTYSFDQEAILLSGNNARAIYSVKHFKGKFNAYQRTYIITILDENEYDYLFLKESLSRQLEYLRTISIGSQTRYLTLGMLTTLQMPKPNIETQKFIGKTIQQFNKKIELIEAKKQTLSDLFKTLLNELMTGQRRVHNIKFN